MSTEEGEKADAPYSGPAPSSSKIFVGSLSWNTSDITFSNYFSKWGEIKDSVVIKDNNGGSRGFGFVTYANPESAGKVFKDKANLELDGRKIECKLAVPRDQMGPGGSITRTKKIFVGGLHDLNEEQFREYFEKFGTVTDCIIMTHPDSGRSRGFGFITYDNEDSVTAVLGQEHQVLGRTVECKAAVPKKRGFGGPGRGGFGGRGFGGGGPGNGGYDDYGGRGGYGRGYGPPPRRGGYGGGGYGRDGYGGGGGYGYGGPPTRGYEGYGYDQVPDYGYGGPPPASGYEGYGGGAAPPGAEGAYGANGQYAQAGGGYAGYSGYGADNRAYTGYGAAPAAAAGGTTSRGSRSYHPYGRGK
eukprot:g67603.t1